MENDEINSALARLEDRVDTKCSSTVFWSSMTVTTGVLVILFGFLFTRQNNLSEAVASINTTLQQTKETSASQSKMLESIAKAQTTLTITVGIMANDVVNTTRAMRALTKEIRSRENISGDVVARIAREQIAWAKERANKKGG